MGAYTTRLSLYKPGGGSTGTVTPDEPVDIDLINGNFDKLDAALGIVSCTSTTYPTAPYKDQWVYVSDLNAVKRWSGTAWVDALVNQGVGTAATRQGIATAPNGSTWLETDTGNTYKWITGTGWVLWDSGLTWTNWGLASGFTTSAGDAPPRWMVRNGTLHVQGLVNGTFPGTGSTYTTVTAATNVPPAAYRSVAVHSGAYGQAGRMASVQLDPTGTLTVAWNNGGTAYTAPAWIAFAFSVPYGT